MLASDLRFPNLTQNRVVITGFGGLTAAGPNISATWDAIKAGKTGIDRISLWDTTNWEYAFGGEIKPFNPRDLIADRKLIKMLSRHDVIGLNAIAQALEHSQILHFRETLSDPTEFNERTGVYAASPGVKFNQQYDLFPLYRHSEGQLSKYAERLFDDVHPMWLLRILSNNVLAYAGIQYGFKGPNQNITNHGVGGSQAILEAFHSLRSGLIDRALVVGYEAALEPQSQLYYASLGVMSKSSIKPFDHTRDGTILAEGAGALILETLESAQARSATIYGEILGGALVSEGSGIFSICKNGSGLKRAVQDALSHTNLKSESIALLTAHANGTILSDAVEARTITEVFAQRPVPTTGFKWSIGHTLTAAGVIELILTTLALHEGVAPGITTLESKASECEALSVSQNPQKLPSSIGMLLTRGFSSLITSLIVTSHIV